MRRRSNVFGRFAAVVMAILMCALLPPASTSALDREDVYRILADEYLLSGDGSTTATILLYPVPLSSGTISPRSESSPIIDVPSLSGNPQWFAFVDYVPCAFFPHAADFVFIDDVTGTVTGFQADNWPDLNYESLGLSDAPGELFIRIVPTVSYVIPAPDMTPASGPIGDYGDAPEGVSAYPGQLNGLFPTYAASINGVGGRPGGHALASGFEMLGDTVSVESDLNDPADGDGHPNQLDGDSDDPFYVIWDPNTAPATGHLLVDVTVTGAAPPGPRYLNVLMDFDRDGRWANNGGHTEWVTRNASLAVLPGQTKTVLTPGFDWPAPDDSVHIWTRLMIDRSPIDSTLFGTSGWDGSGEFLFGEIEDAVVLNLTCRPSGAEVDSTVTAAATVPLSDLAARISIPPGFDPLAGTFDRNKSYVRIGSVRNVWGGSPLKRLFRYHAIIVQGLDNPKHFGAAHSAREMARILERMGFTITHLKVPKPADVLQALDDYIALVPKCEDILYVYLVGHSGGGLRQLIVNNFQDPAAPPGNRQRITAEELRSRYVQLMPCEAPGENCSTVDRACDITTIVDVCNAGSWEDTLAARGRRVFMSNSGAGEEAGMHGHVVWPVWIHSEESWYSHEFVKAGLVSAQGGAKFATALELHNVAAPGVRRISKNTQNPGSYLNACACVQPPKRLGHHCASPVAPVPSGQLTVVEIPVPESFVVAGCELELELSHARTADLHIVLRNPVGQGVVLADGLTGTGFVDALFADDGGPALPAGDGTYYGHFSPLEPLAGLIGSNSAGVWTLEVTNATAGIDGVVDRVCLFLQTPYPTGVGEGPARNHDREWVLSVQRSPSRDSWDISIESPEDDRVRTLDLRIFDVTGRLVRGLYSGPITSSGMSLRWDGRRADGTSPPAGVYFLKLSEGQVSRGVSRIFME